MKTTIKFLVILSFLLLHCSTLFAQSTLESKKLKGAVESVSSTVYRTAMEDGKIKFLSIAQLHKHSYNEAGFMYGKEYQVNTLSMGEGPKRTMVYDFDKENNLIKETTSKNGIEERATQHTYKDGLLVESKYYKAGGTQLGTQDRTYDKNGNKLTSKTIDTEGNPIQLLELTYNEQNKVVSVREMKRGKLVRYYKYEYPNKNEKKAIELDPLMAKETIKSYTITIYDDNENILSSTEYTPERTVERKSIYEYNDQGDRTLRQISDADGVVEDYNYMRYEYDYDKKGNWIQKVEYLKNGNSLDATKREIVYSK